jgi:hypothetical protein
MDVSLEPSVNHPDIVTAPPVEAQTAARKVETYLQRLRVRDRALRHEFVHRVVECAARRVEQEPSRSLTELSMEEMDRALNEWFAQVISDAPTEAALPLSIRGRVALVLADLPDELRDLFLRPGPWPKELVAALRNAQLRAVPELQPVKMNPHALDLGLMAKLAHFVRGSRFRTAAIVIALALALLVLLILIL